MPTRFMATLSPALSLSQGEGEAIDEPVFGSNRQLSEFQETRHPEMPTKLMATLSPALPLSQGEGANLIGCCLVRVFCVPQRLVR